MPVRSVRRSLAVIFTVAAVGLVGCTGGSSSHSGRSIGPTTPGGGSALASPSTAPRSPAETALGMRVVQLRSVVGPVVSALSTSLIRGHVVLPPPADMQRAEAAVEGFDGSTGSYPKSGPLSSLVADMVAANRSLLADLQALEARGSGAVAAAALRADLSRWSSVSTALAQSVGA
jgi:hypothetical protein